MRLTTSCDMGSIKIFNKGMSCFFMNDWGDGTNTVHITKKSKICGCRVDKLPKKYKHNKFLGHFTVKNKAWLSDYDCEDSPLYEFDKGRWFVYLLKPREFHIEKVDNDIHA